jgi:hypothetical protein
MYAGNSKLVMFIEVLYTSSNKNKKLMIAPKLLIPKKLLEMIHKVN